MLRNLQLTALIWANNLASRIEKATSAMLGQLEHFTREDMRDERLNRYPA
jgi:hypothetical protein